MPELRELNQPPAPMPPAGEYRYQQIDPTALKRFEQAVIRHFDEMRRYSKQGRDNRNFENRWARNRNRAQVKVDLTRNDDGSVNTRVGDGHAKLGINQGWVFQANTTATKDIFFKLFRSAPRFYQIQGWGRKHENEKLEHLLERVAEYLLRRGSFYSTIAPQICQMLPIDGSALLRFEFSYPLAMKKLDDGTYHEVMSGQEMTADGQYLLFHTHKALRPELTVWPIADVFVTDWDRQTADQQEAVFWITPQTTVQRLSRDEAVYVWIADEGEQGTRYVKRAYGRFTNLRGLREDEERQMRAGGARSGGTQYQTESSRVTSFPMFSLIEPIGMCPMSRWVKEGVLTPEIAQYFEIDVGYWPQPNVDEMGQPTGDYDKDSLAEWGRRLEAIHYYEIAYTGSYHPDGGQTTGADLGQHLLMFRPCPYAEGRNGLYNFTYFPDRDEFLGLSICDVGWKLENLGDLIRNAQGWRKFFNGNPSALVNTDGLQNETDEEALKVAEPGATVKTRRKIVPAEILQFNHLEGDRDDEEVIASVKFEFENTTGIPAISKGSVDQTSTGTATELQLTAQRSSGQLDMIALRLGIGLCAMVKEMLCLSYKILGPEEWKKLALEAGGLIAADEEHVMNEVANEEFDVIPAIAATEDPAVQSQMLQRLYQLTQMSGQWNDRGFIMLNGSQLRIQGIERALRHGEPPISPVAEHFQMAVGSTVKVHPEDNDMAHIQEHQKMMAALRPAMGGPPEVLKYFSPEEAAEIQKALPGHLEEQIAQYRAKMQMNAVPPGRGSGQQGQPKNPRMDQPGALETDTNAASTTGMRQNINQRAMEGA